MEIINDANVRVAVRCRPFNLTEKTNNEASCVTIFEDKIVLKNPNNLGDEQSFAFDLIFDQESFQTSVWDAIGAPILAKAFDGYNGTIFAYGQTGSGKTWSMQGAPEGGELQGIIPRLNNALFDQIESIRKTKSSLQFLVTASYFEIYNEVIFDLLDVNDRKKKSNTGKGGLEIKEHPILGVYVKGLQEHVVENAIKLQRILDQGMKSRTVASTQMNADSSRSHSVFVITVRQKDTLNEEKNIFAKVNLVDLAGSERVKSTGASGATLKEGANINKSLSELGNVINALVALAKGKKGVFVPYRNSKLTRVLQESLGGNSITAMLAALSPAGSYFDETLSTLKYANRAKAIKVNAIKNEEASQVNKLNDEIRQLKEKLEGQSSNIDSTVMEERHRQQLLDLEEAMKSTWEAKSKVSEEHQRERQRLELEQRAAVLQSDAIRKRNWELLEEKDDLEVSMNHIKEISMNDSSMSKHVFDWNSGLKNIKDMENNLREQYTVIQIYRSATEKDMKELFKSSIAAIDTNTFSLWNQLNLKLVAIHNEVEKWTNLQNVLIKNIHHLSITIQGSTLLLKNTKKKDTDTENTNLSDKNDSEMFLGMDILCRQVENKKIKTMNEIHEKTAKLGNFLILGKELLITMRKYEDLVRSCVQEDLELLSPRSSENIKKSTDDLIAKMKECNTILSKKLSLNFPSNSDHKENESSEVNVNIIQNSEIKFNVGALYQIEKNNSNNDINPKTILKKIENTKKDIMINENIFWIFNNQISTMSDGNNNKNNDHEKIFFDIVLKDEILIFSIFLQGGFVDSNSTISANLSSSPSSFSSSSPSSSSTIKATSLVKTVISSGNKCPKDFKLPCGVNISNAEGDTASTINSINDVFQWSEILKKTPPEKYLVRPPVRFLFDLFTYCSKRFYDLFPVELSVSSWDDVGNCKQTKLDYVTIMLDFISNYLDVDNPNSAGSIVSGTDVEKTNILIQYIAIAIHWNTVQNLSVITTKNNSGNDNKSISSGKESEKENEKEEEKDDMNNLISRCSKSSSPLIEDSSVVGTWPRKVSISISLDGIVWSKRELYGKNQFYATSLEDPESKVEVKLLQDGVRAKFIRIHPLEWEDSLNSKEDSSEVPRHNGGKYLNTLEKNRIGCALRVSVRAYVQQTGGTVHTSSTMARSEVGNVPCLSSILTALKEVTVVTLTAISHLTKAEEKRKIRKQDDIRKEMKNLAHEKFLLELRLENEKKESVNEKENLSDQLKSTLELLRKSQNMYAEEHLLKLQYENEIKSIESEKLNLTVNLQIEMDKAVELKNELLSKEVSQEKNKMVIDTLRLQIENEKKIIDELEIIKNKNLELKEIWDFEKSDFNNQITVLTEERDTAQNNEEILYEKLEEKTTDLEILQDSYVDKTDQCNEYTDEISDLKEELFGYQNAIKERNAVFLSRRNSRDIPNLSHMNKEIPIDSADLNIIRSFDSTDANTLIKNNKKKENMINNTKEKKSNNKETKENCNSNISASDVAKYDEDKSTIELKTDNKGDINNLTIPRTGSFKLESKSEKMRQNVGIEMLLMMKKERGDEREKEKEEKTKIFLKNKNENNFENIDGKGKTRSVEKAIQSNDSDEVNYDDDGYDEEFD